MVNKIEDLFRKKAKRLRIVNEDPEYNHLQPTGAKPYTLFKSVYTNNTDRPQEYSFKTERTTESLCLVCKEQGYSIGQEAELSLKTPCEILEMKAGFKYEMNFNQINENSISELLTWGVDSNVVVPPHFQTVASIMIEELNYQGSYVLVSRIAGPVSINIRRRKDGNLVQAVTTNIVEVFKELFETGHVTKDVKAMVTVEPNAVKLVSKGTCSFQFAMKQKIDLTEAAMPISAIEKETMMMD
uniref:Vitellogenin n=1 Tax=Plectus sambesii TaxID=2011161 RepID=A0A914V9C7_9BILA